MIKIGVSRCLLGEPVRYDGGHKLNLYIAEVLAKDFDLVPVCPEVEYGMPVPREPMRLVGNPADPHLYAINTDPHRHPPVADPPACPETPLDDRGQTDHAKGMNEWAQRRVDEFEGEHFCGFIFKARSPSCGTTAVPVLDAATGLANPVGRGLFARVVMARFPHVPVVEEWELDGPSKCEEFARRVRAVDRLYSMRSR